MKIAVFPGTFDPITKGHESIIKRAIPLFDKIIVAIGDNSSKNRTFPLEKRIAWIKKTFEKEPSIEVKTYKGLTVDFCKEQKANYILRGLRSTIDFEYEQPIAQMNKNLNSSIESFFLFTDPEYSAISSLIVREIHKHKGNVSQFIPKDINLNQ